MRFIKIAAVAGLAFTLTGSAFAQGGGNSNDVEAATSGPSAGEKAGGMQKGGSMEKGGMEKSGSMPKESPGSGPSAGGTTGSPAAPTGR